MSAGNKNTKVDDGGAGLREKLRVFNYNDHQSVRLSDDHLDHILGLINSEQSQLIDRLVEALPEKLDESGGWATLPSGQSVQDKDVANWNRGHNAATSKVTDILLKEKESL